MGSEIQLHTQEAVFILHLRCDSGSVSLLKLDHSGQTCRCTPSPRSTHLLWEQISPTQPTCWVLTSLTVALEIKSGIVWRETQEFNGAVLRVHSHGFQIRVNHSSHMFRPVNFHDCSSWLRKPNKDSWKSFYLTNKSFTWLNSVCVYIYIYIYIYISYSAGKRFLSPSCFVFFLHIFYT